jgi:DNA-binding CsgD family transcriptional regulator
MAAPHTHHLRALERRVIDLAASGLASDEIGQRFRRSPGHIERIMEWARLPGRTGRRAERSLLSPMERRVLDLRADGHDHAAIGERFRRGADHIRRVEGIAHFKLAHELLGG